MVYPALALTVVEVSTYFAIRLPYLKRRRAGEWRGVCPIHRGKRENFTVDPETGRWFCHSKCARGGDVFNLECDLTGVNFRAAKAEVMRLVGRPEGADSQQVPRAGVWQAARDVSHWRLGRVAELERLKADAVRRADESALAAFASELHRLQSDGAAVVALYREHVQSNPEHVVQLIAWALDDECHAQRITATVVLLLATSEAQK